MDETQMFGLLGMTGSLIMCASSIPQIIKTYRTKCVNGLSATYLAILIMGMLLILSYALYKRDVVFICGNGLSLFLTGILVAMYWRYR
jgi:MtN3 and saliva related transmembrane protein